MFVIYLRLVFTGRVVRCIIEMESDSNSPKPVRHRQVTSFSKRPTLSSPPISKNNSVANSDPTCKRRVTFPDDDSLLNASIHSGDEIWRVDPNTTNDIIIDAYTAACLHVRRQPLSVVIEQISVSQQTVLIFFRKVQSHGQKHGSPHFFSKV